MEMALNEITLVVFTTLAPAGVMGFVFLAFVILFIKDEMQAKHLSNYLVLPLALALIGFICSATHLGTPANALYVLTGVGRSPLSNEVFFAVLFLSLGGTLWMLSFGHFARTKLVNIAMAVSSVLGLICILFVSLAYSVPTIPTWNFWTFPLTLWFNAVVGGAVVALSTVFMADIKLSNIAVKIVIAVSVFSIIANAILLIYTFLKSSGISTSFINAQELVPLFPLTVLLFCAFAGLGTYLSYAVSEHRGVALLAKRTKLIGVQLVSLVCALLACFIVRFTFYAMYMTIGL